MHATPSVAPSKRFSHGDGVNSPTGEPIKIWSGRSAVGRWDGSTCHRLGGPPQGGAHGQERRESSSHRAAASGSGHDAKRASPEQRWLKEPLSNGPGSAKRKLRKERSLQHGQLVVGIAGGSAQRSGPHLRGALGGASKPPQSLSRPLPLGRFWLPPPAPPPFFLSFPPPPLPLLFPFLRS